MKRVTPHGVGDAHRAEGTAQYEGTSEAGGGILVKFLLNCEYHSKISQSAYGCQPFQGA